MSCRPIIFLLLLACSATPVVLAQTPADSAASQSVDAPIVKLEPLYTLAKEGATGADASRDGCDLAAKSRKIPQRAPVVLLRKVICSHRYLGERPYIELFYNGMLLYVEEGSLAPPPGGWSELAGRKQADIEPFKQAWRVDSKGLSAAAKLLVLRKVESSKPLGVAIVDAHIYDTSEYTEGTGFKGNFYNSGKKTIKYISVSMKGLNAVRDPVRDRFTKSATVTFRGIGPIEPGDSASYSKDYMWSSDLVQSFDIVSIKLDFMDGSSRTLTGKQLVWLTAAEREQLEEPDD